MCMPGDNVEMTVELIHNVAMEQGLRFAIREGGRTVGSGAVAKIKTSPRLKCPQYPGVNLKASGIFPEAFFWLAQPFIFLNFYHHF